MVNFKGTSKHKAAALNHKLTPVFTELGVLIPPLATVSSLPEGSSEINVSQVSRLQGAAGDFHLLRGRFGTEGAEHLVFVCTGHVLHSLCCLHPPPLNVLLHPALFLLRVDNNRQLVANTAGGIDFYNNNSNDTKAGETFWQLGAATTPHLAKTMKMSDLISFLTTLANMLTKSYHPADIYQV